MVKSQHDVLRDNTSHEELRKALDADAEKDGLARGCAFCGGLEHRITNCPKLMKDQRRLNPTNSDAMRTDAGGDW